VATGGRDELSALDERFFEALSRKPAEAMAVLS